MDFIRLKRLVVPEGEVKELKIGGRVVWRKNTGGYGVEITTDNTEPVTDFTLGQSGSKTFTADFTVPEEEQTSTETWSFEGLPEGLSASGATVSGSATSTGISTVTVTVTKGSYSDTKAYTFRVYGLMISTETLPSGTKGSSYSATLGVTKDLPEGVDSLVYYAANLHSGLSLNSSTGAISGTPTETGTKSISVYATQSPYTSATKELSLAIAAQTPGFTSSSSSMIIPAAYLRSSSYVDTQIATLDVSGVKLDMNSAQLTVMEVSSMGKSEYISNRSYLQGSVTDFQLVLCGNKNVSNPVLSVAISRQSTYIRLTFKLSTYTNVNAIALEDRGETKFVLYVEASGHRYMEHLVSIGITK